MKHRSSNNLLERDSALRDHALLALRSQDACFSTQTDWKWFKLFCEIDAIQIPSVNR